MRGQKDPYIIRETPDRQNIFLDTKMKLSSVDSIQSYEDIFQPECDRLFVMKEKFPVTIMYIPLKYMSYAAAYLFDLFGYEEINSSIYSVIYANQDKEVMNMTTRELKKATPRIRMVLSTSVSGMGFDPECVTRVVHARPPRNITQYMQEIGRAGRRGQRSEAILYYNNNDIAKNLPSIQSDIIEYCKNRQKCLRSQLLSTFGFEKGDTLGCKCCSFCKCTCTCSRCLIVQLEDDFQSDLSFHENIV